MRSITEQPDIRSYLKPTEIVTVSFARYPDWRFASQARTAAARALNRSGEKRADSISTGAAAVADGSVM